MATNLSSLANNNNARYNLGNGEYSPRCLSWLPPGTTEPIFNQLTKAGGDWLKSNGSVYEGVICATA